MTKILYMDIPRELQKLREDNRWTQAEAARLARVHMNTYRAWEKGRAQPSITGIENLVNAAGMTLSEFLCGDAYMREPWEYRVIKAMRELPDAERRDMWESIENLHFMVTRKK